MTGHEFLRRLTKLAKAQGVQVVYDPRHGKGSYGRNDVCIQLSRDVSQG